MIDSRPPQALVASWPRSTTAVRPGRRSSPPRRPPLVVDRE